MNADISLIDLSQFSKPVTVLIEKISDAVGGIYKPHQIRRVAEAEADAEKIKAVTQIEITQLQHRAITRFFEQEAKKQINMESITQKALSQVNEDAKPQDVEDDWIANFFDKCRLISNEEMQSLWAKILAGEANSPGKYSTRTVNFLSSMDKSDATLFTQLCCFGCFVGSNFAALIYDQGDKIYTKNGITFDSITHLEEIGLLTFESLTTFSLGGLPKIVKILYHGDVVNIEFKSQNDNDLDVGKVKLSKTGQELAPISGSKAVRGFIDYLLVEWNNQGCVVYSDWPKILHPP